MKCIESQGRWPGVSKDSGPGLWLAFAQLEGLPVQAVDGAADWFSFLSGSFRVGQIHMLAVTSSSLCG